MNRIRRSVRAGLVPAALLSGLCLIVATFIVSATVMQTKASSKRIRVKGYAEKRITSDFAIWTGQLTARSPDLADAYAVIERNRDRVLEFLVSQGVERAAVDLGVLAVETRYKAGERGGETSVVEAYILRQPVRLELADVKRIESIARASGGLAREGIEFQSFAPEYHYTHLEELKIEMLGAATQDAMLRARKIAEHGGIRIDRLRSAEQGVFQVTPVHSTEVSGYGLLDTTAIDKTIKAVVDAEFGVE